MPHAYYNENDPKAAAWLRELIAQNLIAPGFVDQRSIAEVRAADLHGYTQCHFFAGIGGWSLALRLAGWPDSRPVWTASCPCQPFSNAGKRKGSRDKRHLWPVFHHLLAQSLPPIAFGEQVASKAGRLWLARLRLDLETLAYAVGAADLCAAGISAPHIRQRLFWLAHSRHKRTRWAPTSAQAKSRRALSHSSGRCPRCGLAHSAGMPGPELRTQSRPRPGAGPQNPAEHSDALVGWPTPQALSFQEPSARHEPRHGQDPRRDSHRLGHADRAGFGELRGSLPMEAPQCPGCGHWSDSELIPCLDGKARRIKSGLQPLAHGVPGRVGRLRGYGNAIVPPLAAQFIAAYLDTEAG